MYAARGAFFFTIMRRERGKGERRRRKREIPFLVSPQNPNGEGREEGQGVPRLLIKVSYHH